MITIKDIEKLVGNAENINLLIDIRKLYNQRYMSEDYNRQYKMAVKQLRQNINALM